MTNIPAAAWALPAGVDAFDGVSGLKQKGTGNSSDATEKLKSSAQEFEALFLGYMLNVMRSTIEESGLTEKGLGQSTYTEMFDQEVARRLSKRGALGISDLLIRNLTPQILNQEPENNEAVGAVKLSKERSGGFVSLGLPPKNGKQ